MEMILAATSGTPLTDDELTAFQNLPISVAHLTADKQLVLFDPTRGAGGRLTSDKGTEQATQTLDDSDKSVLLVPQRAERELVVVASLDRERERGSAGVVKSPKGIVYDDFIDRLDRRFQAYRGLVFPHAK